MVNSIPFYPIVYSEKRKAQNYIRESYLVDKIETRRQNPVFRIILDYKVILFIKLFYILLTPDYWLWFFAFRFKFLAV